MNYWLFLIAILILFTTSSVFATSDDPVWEIDVQVNDDSSTVICSQTNPNHNSNYTFDVYIGYFIQSQRSPATFTDLENQDYNAQCRATIDTVFTTLINEEFTINENYVDITFNEDTKQVFIDWDFGTDSTREDCRSKTELKFVTSSNDKQLEKIFHTFHIFGTNMTLFVDRTSSSSIVLDHDESIIPCTGSVSYNQSEFNVQYGENEFFIFMSFYDVIQPKYREADPFAGNKSGIRYLNEAILVYSNIGTFDIISCDNGIVPFSKTTELVIDIEKTVKTTVSKEACVYVAPSVEIKKKGGSSYNPPPTLGMDNYGKRFVENGFSYNGNKVNADRYHTEYPLITTNVGDKNILELIIYENRGKNNLKWVQVMLGVKEVGTPNSLAEVIGHLILSNQEFESFTITDKQNLIQNFNATSIEPVKCKANSTNEACLKIIFEYEYREAPLYNVIAINLMDVQRSSATSFFNDGVNVLGESLNIPPTDSKFSKHSSQIPGIWLELTRTDKVNDIWTDQFGIEYEKSNNGNYERITPFVFEKDIDAPVSVMTRIHSSFEGLIDAEIQKAISIYDASQYISIPDESFTHEISIRIDKSNDPELLERMQIEADRAGITLQEMFDHIYAGKVND